ncbi:MAG: hypothetical protein KDA96_06055 [Planctomycetaceae bacterium]|nr:hypothetical protein [Planctomycetaceae bacterium]
MLSGWKSLGVGMGIMLAAWNGLVAEEQKPREQIGEVFGKPVYRDQIANPDPAALRDQVLQLFLVPLMERYQEEHAAELTPTEAELATAEKFFNEQHEERIRKEKPAMTKRLAELNDLLAAGKLPEEESLQRTRERSILIIRLTPPGRDVATMLLRNWKLQKSLYDRYGGGRILFQQGGLEAFDASLKWLKAEEERGWFKITDAKLRTTFYEYWTTMDHGAFLTADEKRIRKEFLEPEWLPKKK